MESNGKEEISFKGIFTKEDRIQRETRIYTKDLWKAIEEKDGWKKECGLDQKKKTE